MANVTMTVEVEPGHHAGWYAVLRLSHEHAIREDSLMLATAYLAAAGIEWNREERRFPSPSVQPGDFWGGPGHYHNSATVRVECDTREQADDVAELIRSIAEKLNGGAVCVAMSKAGF
jgi:hypothetical protein